jgi:hypothetical protein
VSVPAVPTEAVKASALTKLDDAAYALVRSPAATPAVRAQAVAAWKRGAWDDHSLAAIRRAWFELRALARGITAAPVRMVASQPRSAPRRRGAGRPAGKRAAARGDDSGDDGPVDPWWPRRIAGHVALDLRAGRSHTVAVASVRDARRICRALDRLAVAYALAKAIDGAGLAVTFTPEGATT